jgi:ATP-dependent helicase/nuclease subunit A
MSTELLKQESLAHDVGAHQRKASNPHQSVWVAASAGSGKTKVLADRVTRLLLDGVKPERILCLTFTRAAAAEMSIRMSQRLSRWATCDETTLDKDLDDLQNVPADQDQRDRARRLFARVLACPGGLRLQTIHAFAQEILRRFPLEAGLAPHFTVMEEADANALWREAFDELLENIAEGKESVVAQAFARLISSLGEDSLISILRETRGQETRLRGAVQTCGGVNPLVADIRVALDLQPDDTEEEITVAATREGAFDRGKLLIAARLVADKGSSMFVERARLILEWLEKDEAGRVAGLLSLIHI